MIYQALLYRTSCNEDLQFRVGFSKYIRRMCVAILSDKWKESQSDPFLSTFISTSLSLPSFTLGEMLFWLSSTCVKVSIYNWGLNLQMSKGKQRCSKTDSDMNFWARRAFVIQWRHDSLIPPGDGPIIGWACMSTNRSMGMSVIHWQRRTHYISGLSYVKLVSRRTARHATICHVDGLVNRTYSERGSTHSRDYASRNIEHNIHDLIKIQCYEYYRNEIGQETGMLRWATLPFIRETPVKYTRTQG